MTSNATFQIALRGDAVLTNPRFNKGTAFNERERREFGLLGRLPHRINTLDEQCERAYAQFQASGRADSQISNLMQHSFLESLKQQNWVLYYSLISRHLTEMVPIIYTPTEADAIAQYSHLFRRSEGLFLCFDREKTMEDDYLEQTRGRDVDLIVCSDAEAILGIGDQGTGGIGISAAKAVIYTLIAGVDPSKTLSVTLDVGTNNKELLDDPLYVGWRHERVRGERYDTFVDSFVQLVRKHHPHCLLHFEDFGVENAYRLLERYKNQHPVFNDDIQGTGAVTLACIMAAVGVTKTKLSDQRYVIFGAGSAGLGIARQIRDAILAIDGESETRESANSRFYLVDRHGLIRRSLGPENIRKDLEEFVRPDEEWKDVPVNGDGEIELLEVVKHIKPTVLIGCSTKSGAFDEKVVKAMYKLCDHRPIILPLSNPSRLVEVTPQDANDWTDGKVLIATGSPFPTLKMPNGKDYVVAECNNALIYPGIGLGAIVSQARTVTDAMIIAAARRLASLSPALKDVDDALLPDFESAAKVNMEVAIAVAEQAVADGTANASWGKEHARSLIEERRWKPIYGEYFYDKEGAR